MGYGEFLNTPPFCECGEKNNADHALSCKKGGYINMRHDQIRNLEADFMKAICRDVKIEPHLIPICKNNGNTTDQAWLVLPCVAIWGPMEKNYFRRTRLSSKCTLLPKQRYQSSLQNP